MKERWVPVKGFEGLYEVSSHGRVRSLSRAIVYRDGRVHRKIGQFVKPRPNKKRGNYLGVGLCRHSIAYDFQLHRLVAMHFIANPKNKPQVNHDDGIKSNCRVDNLEWATAKENGEHAARTGLIGTRSISPDLARRIKKWIQQGGKKVKDIVDKFGVSKGVADGILNDVSWRWI